MITLNGHEIKPTIFPDKTSQVWKVPEEYIYHGTPNVVTWEFENEAEFMWVAQLKFLLDFTVEAKDTILELPYLPYARQDKPVSNTATFALMPFFLLLDDLFFAKIRIVDPHNIELVKECLPSAEIIPAKFDLLLEDLNALPVYPDAGAAKRYDASPNSLTGEKDRDPLTGEIKGIIIKGNVKPVSYLIIDDICDGGRTFIEVAKKLYEAGAKEVHLYVSHGIFSKGLQVLRDAGIKRIFTRKGEVL